MYVTLSPLTFSRLGRVNRRCPDQRAMAIGRMQRESYSPTVGAGNVRK
jgi:hypothetical protein